MSFQRKPFDWRVCVCDVSHCPGPWQQSELVTLCLSFASSYSVRAITSDILYVAFCPLW